MRRIGPAAVEYSDFEEVWIVFIGKVVGEGAWVFKSEEKAKAFIAISGRDRLLLGCYRVVPGSAYIYEGVE